MTIVNSSRPDHRQNFRDAMARMAAAVKIVTTDGPAGRAGMTATAACSVSEKPPRLLVCVNTSASSHPAIAGNRRLAINVLAQKHSDAALAFGGKIAQENRFDSSDWHPDSRGQPVLAGACATFSCAIADSFPAGTHTIFLCDVLEACANDSALPLIYLDRTLVPVPQPET
ncbi:flavin reductase family protein [Mangrovicoccus sp. HB161399]|uniref:flavin reductase family protein n=1 Tax=Mangrovicoccus sp. HB161399 TaxID=2720392 RepID=UPI001C1312C7|nr:flavin reductase family protein [Mangrovicoccus sp. HB161399]